MSSILFYINAALTGLFFGLTLFATIQNQSLFAAIWAGLFMANFLTTIRLIRIKK